MSIAEPTESQAGESPVPAPAVKRPSLRKRAMHAVRRAHLYFGLFLLPWAILYGATGFLFNHPEAFADSPTTPFGRSELAGTPMENPPAPAEVAEQIVAALRARANPPVDYQLVEPERARYTREFAFATIKAGDTEVSLLFDATGGGGTVRSRTVPMAAPAPVEKPPFAVGGGLKTGGPPRGGRGEKGGGAPRPSPASTQTESLALDAPLHERVKAAVPVVLERTGFPTGAVTVTSVPDLSFRMTDGSKVWAVAYNAMTGSVGGTPADAAPPAEELSTRRFLTRLHTAHGYPSSQNSRWWWAVVVDAMAFVMVFWGVSGVFMWLQIKATRKFGFVVLVLSIAAAVALGVGMHDTLTAR